MKAKATDTSENPDSTPPYPGSEGGRGGSSGTPTPNNSADFEIPSLAAALQDPALLGAALTGPPGSWNAWIAIAKAFEGLTLDDAEAALFSEIAGGREPPTAPVLEGWIIAGRRSGKSVIASAIAVHAGVFGKFDLAPGEVGHVCVIAPSRDQAQICWNYCRGFLESSPLLRSQIAELRSDELVLRNGIRISTLTANFRSLRGRTICLAILDESSFFRSDESAQPDVEILNALRPALATTKGRLVSISSPYAPRGILHSAYSKSYGEDDPLRLVVKAPTRTLNPTIDASIISTALEDDPAAGRSEWLAEFRQDISSFIDADTLSAMIEPGTTERWPAFARYVAFADLSAGRNDSSVLAIAHCDADDGPTLDFVREVPAPHSPSDIIAEFAVEMRRWKIARCFADRYASAYVTERFSEHGIRHVPSDPKSQLYTEILPRLRSRACSLLDNPRMVQQFANLERRTGRGGTGRDVIDHPRHGRDDVANAVAGALVYATREAGRQNRASFVRVETAMAGAYDVALHHPD